MVKQATVAKLEFLLFIIMIFICYSVEANICSREEIAATSKYVVPLK